MTDPRTPADDEASEPQPSDTRATTDDFLARQVGQIVDGAETRTRGAAPQHTREGLDREEREIKDNVLRMGSLVADQIMGAMAALEAHDAEAATAVIIRDGRLNEVQRTISSLIARTIATQQPVARDLRFLLALDHVGYELERMGDHAASVAKQARKLAPHPPLGHNVHLPEMGDLCARQVREVLHALVEVDEGRARQVAAVDDDIDRLYHATFDEVLDLMRHDPDNVDRGARILFAAHYLERIGDRVTNIAEDVVFLATGDIEDLNP
ncbi:MAG: phosphate transport system protein [Chloroflexota bacterium]|jgi:phosphate transport system protein|nr:phosphate transport system protein [Chloroflexota bacterium]